MKLLILGSFLLSATAAFSAPYRQIYIASRTEQNQGAGTPNSCYLQVAEYDSRYAIEWRVSSSSPTWMITNPNSGFLITAGGDTATDCRSLSTCFVHGDRGIAGSELATTYINASGLKQSFKANIPYYFAARQFIDDNGNGVWDRGEFIREWTPALTVTSSADYNHRCTFNTFPAN